MTRLNEIPTIMNSYTSCNRMEGMSRRSEEKNTDGSGETHN